MEPVDDKFYDRADECIDLANDQCGDIGRGKVSASLMCATARLNTWISACGFASDEEMKKEREKTIEYFVIQYRSMLEENLDDYIGNCDSYMQTSAKKA